MVHLNNNLVNFSNFLKVSGPNSFQFVESVAPDYPLNKLNGEYKLETTEAEASSTPSSPVLKQNLILTSTPFNNSVATDLLKLNELNKNSRSKVSENETEGVHEVVNERTMNDTNTRPKFASELTNSQISEELSELSHEIGLLCE